jgi:hypothetical protein
MRFLSWLDGLKPVSSRRRTKRGQPRSPRQKPPGRKLSVETLEDRCMPSFLAPVNYEAGLVPNDPTAVVTADFNADGRLDLAVTNYYSNTVSVLLGNPDGTFQPALTSATGATPFSLAVGDFNADGKLDIVTANAYDLSVLLGNQDGTFQPPSTIPDDNLSYGSVAVGDFNADGKLDLGVVANQFDYYYGTSYSYANVLLGNGDGSFSEPNQPTYLGQGTVHSAAVGDFNSDGKLDLATDNSDGAVFVLLNDGNGNLQAPTWFNTGGSPVSVAAGDVNGDGNTDLVAANRDGGNVSVLLGNGLGAFGAAQNYAAGTDPYAVELGDFNNDGKLDIATPNAGSDDVTVLLGRGDGTFALPRSSTVGGSPWRLAAGDFNGDGWLDIATAPYTGNNVSVMLNAADWSPTGAPATHFVVSGFPSSTTAGTTGTFTVTAETASGTTATGYTGPTVHFTSSDPQAVLPADYTFTAADQGVHTFSATLKTAGAQSLTVTDTTTASLTGSATGITVAPAAANHLAVSGPPGSPAGSAFSVILTALDPYNNTATGYTGAVDFTSSDGQAVLPGEYAFTASDAGVHTFTSGVTLKTAGNQTVAARDTLASAITGSTAVWVSPAAASSMTVAGFPSSATAGVAGTFTVTLKDRYGNIVTKYTGTVHFTSSDAQGVLPVNYTFTAADAGVHSFSATLKTAGTKSITVTDTTTASLIGTDGGITVNPAAASQFIISAPSSVSAGVPFSLTVSVEDAYGNVVTGYTGTIHLKSTDKTANLPADYTFTAADQGVHTFTGLILRKKGKQKITLTDTINNSITGSVIENVL